MNATDITLSKRSLTQNRIYCVKPFIQSIKLGKTNPLLGKADKKLLLGRSDWKGIKEASWVLFMLLSHLP